MIKFKSGNLIALMKNGHYDIVMHGMNCHCKMSDGFALQLAKEFPEVEISDFKTIPLDKNKLGTFIPVELRIKNKKVTVLNCYTQFNYAGYDIEESDLFNYEAFREILKKISKLYNKEKIGMPLIGSGHAGCDMNKIIKIIKEELNSNNVDIIIYCVNNEPKELNSLSNKIKCLLF